MTEDARLGRVNPFASTLCAAVLGLVISVCAWLSVSATDERLALQVFNENATNNEMALESGLGRYTPESYRLLRCREMSLWAISDILHCGNDCPFLARG